MKILLLGPQGSGKGTQAKRIASEYGLAHVATGDMLRAEIAGKSEFGLRVKPILDAGELVPDEWMVDLIRQRLEEDDAQDGFILDGFPRTMAQADALDEMLREVGRELDVVFVLQLADEICIQRMLKRAEEEGRSDDAPDVIRRRLKTFHAETAPLIEHYRARGIVIGIHADRTIDSVFGEIQETLDQVATR